MKKRRATKVPYKEGDWFVVPLKNRGYGLGLVARSNARGVILGYFFGPRHMEVPALAATGALQPKEAVLVEMFGDLGIIEGKWPVLGSVGPWNRKRWRVPLFVRKDAITGECELVEYSDENLDELRTVPCSAKEANKHPQDGISGYGAVEILLSRALG